MFGNNIESCGNAGFGDQRLNPRNVRSARIRSRNLRIRVNLAQNLRSFKSAARNGVNVCDFQSLRIRIRRASRPDVRLIQNLIRIDHALHRTDFLRQIRCPFGIILRQEERFFSAQNVVQAVQRIDSRLVKERNALKPGSVEIPDSGRTETELFHQLNADVDVVVPRTGNVDSETADHRARTLDHAEREHMLVNAVARLRGHIKRHPAARSFRNLHQNALFRGQVQRLFRSGGNHLSEDVLHTPAERCLFRFSGGFEIQIRNNRFICVIRRGVLVQNSGNPHRGVVTEFRIQTLTAGKVINPNGGIFGNVEAREHKTVLIAVAAAGAADDPHAVNRLAVSGDVQRKFLPFRPDRNRF